MAAVWYRARAELRQDWRTVAILAVICGLVGGAALTAAAGARRTDSAYGRFLVAQRAYDVMVINYPEDGAAVFDLAELARLPQVAEAARAEYGYVSIGPGYPYLASGDGRIGTAINRSKLLAGRRADPVRPDEAVVSVTLAEEEGLEVGDTFQLFDPAELEAAESELSEVSLEEQEERRTDIAEAKALVAALPGARLRVVGIQAAPGELPPPPPSYWCWARRCCGSRHCGPATIGRWPRWASHELSAGWSGPFSPRALRCRERRWRWRWRLRRHRSPLSAPLARLSPSPVSPSTPWCSWGAAPDWLPPWPSSAPSAPGGPVDARPHHGCERHNSRAGWPGTAPASAPLSASGWPSSPVRGVRRCRSGPRWRASCSVWPPSAARSPSGAASTACSRPPTSTACAGRCICRTTWTTNS
ncbi:MAG TPA: hypothetical protein VM142_15065 [Acidimicrobiales bacterium]|nr:hypothetical protein [Acidimicrobiales bacterium]